MNQMYWKPKRFHFCWTKVVQDYWIAALRGAEVIPSWEGCSHKLSVPHGNHTLQLRVLKIISPIVSLRRVGNTPKEPSQPFSRHQTAEKTSLFPLYVFFPNSKHSQLVELLASW